MHISNCHFSDNSRSWIHKGTNPTAGATKSVTNTTFVGFTRNTGHKLCQWDQTRDYTSKDLLELRQCADPREGAVDLLTLKPMADLFERRNVYWYKPQGDVYRLLGQDQWYPWQAMSIYDSFIPTMVQNVTFYDYPAKDGDARRHALGAHFSHKFNLIPKCFALRDIKERVFISHRVCLVLKNILASLFYFLSYSKIRNIFLPFNTQANKSKTFESMLMWIIIFKMLTQAAKQRIATNIPFGRCTVISMSLRVQMESIPSPMEN